jgi:hypothetical protein
MNLELDHVFILVEPEARVADLLIVKGFKPTFSSPTDETQKKSPKNRNLILKKKVNPVNGRLVSVNNPLTNFGKASNSQKSMIKKILSAKNKGVQ